MSEWVIRTFTTLRGGSVLMDWRAEVSPAVWAAFEVRWRFLRANPKSEWRRPYFAPLTGPCKGLHEIRFKEDNVQWRPIGAFGPGRGEFTILLVATERDGRLVPEKACETCQRRRKLIAKDPRHAREFTID